MQARFHALTTLFDDDIEENMYLHTMSTGTDLTPPPPAPPMLEPHPLDPSLYSLYVGTCSHLCLAQPSPAGQGPRLREIAIE
jgi:hypothetical protein